MWTWCTQQDWLIGWSLKSHSGPQRLCMVPVKLLLALFTNSCYPIKQMLYPRLYSLFTLNLVLIGDWGFLRVNYKVRGIPLLLQEWTTHEWSIKYATDEYLNFSTPAWIPAAETHLPTRQVPPATATQLVLIMPCALDFSQATCLDLTKTTVLVSKKQLSGQETFIKNHKEKSRFDHKHMGSHNND